MKTPQPEYLLYATLLDSYSDYIHSDIIYSEYWGFSNNPPFSEDEFREKKRLDLINRINRVPMKWEDSEKADRGTAFNEIVDCIIAGKKSDKMEIKKIFTTYTEMLDAENKRYEEVETNRLSAIEATYNNRTFTFPISVCKEFANYLKCAISQVHTEAILQTKYGDVLLYGYIDELMPASVHDIKTTGKYKAGKFKRNWQHVVYPYCLNKNGCKISNFEYNILLIGKGTYETFVEHYNYVPETDITRLAAHVEAFIEFIEANRDVITDLKIFNKHSTNDGT